MEITRSFFETEKTDYQDIQFLSAQLDAAFGIPVKEIEKSLREKARALQPEGTVESWSRALHNGACTWVGLNPAQLQTPYTELLEILDELELMPGDKVIDLGAGYGRMGVLIGSLFKDCFFEGFEMAPERVSAGNKVFKKLGIVNAELFTQDIASREFKLPDAKCYFIYDFGFLSDMKKLLRKLDKKADELKSLNVLARGRGINSLIKEAAPWLTVYSRPIGNSSLYTYKG